MNIADIERVVERLLVRDIQAKFARAFNRAERRTQRTGRACLMGNTVAPGCDWKPVMHDPVFKVV